MNQSLTIIGGARLGGIKVPLASLMVTREALDLRVLFFFSYKFTQEQVFTLQASFESSFSAGAVRIEHTIEKFPFPIEFANGKGPEQLLEEIRHVGFTPSAPVSAKLSREGGPVRLFTITVAILLLGGGLLLDYAELASPESSRMFNDEHFHLTAAVAAIASVLIMMPFSPLFQRLALKEGRHIGEANPARFVFLVFIAAPYLLIVALVWLGYMRH